MTESRICQEVQAQLPAYTAGSLGPWRRRLVRLHLKRCPDCQTEEARQREVTAGLRELAEAGAGAGEPPEGLLETLLEQAENTGIRGRAAVPARGAVSGARPALSVGLLVMGAAAGTAAGYAGWRGARALRSRLTRSEGEG
jgi:anti-sigma factor RsiW